MPPRNDLTMDVDAGPTAMDVEMEDTEDHGMSNGGASGGGFNEASSNAGSSGGVETPPQPQQPYRIPRRGSMSEDEERERRASIKAILADKSISPQSRRRSIQHLMDGRRGSLGTSSHGSVNSGNSSVASDASSHDDTA